MLHILEIIGKTNDNILIWRGVLRIANDDLQESVKPSQLNWPKKRVLAAMDKLEVKEMAEKNSLKAVERLLEKLLEIEKPVDWPELFLESLEPQFPEVAAALRSLAEKLEADVFTDATLYMNDDGGDKVEEGKT